ncbi:unnamed protein product, partial [Chrysoparadoxa australica]
MKVPENLSQLRSFLGLASYYRRFVKDMSKKTKCLTDLLKKDVEFCMGEKEISTCKWILKELSRNAVQAYPNFEAAYSGKRRFKLQTDACLDGLGAVLSQDGPDGRERILHCASRTMLPNEKNWDVGDLELAAVVYGLRKFKHILWGSSFNIYTDHQSIKYL